MCTTYLLQQPLCCMALSLSLVPICAPLPPLSSPTTTDPTSPSTLLANLCCLDYSDLPKRQQPRHQLPTTSILSSSMMTYINDYLNDRQHHHRLTWYSSIGVKTDRIQTDNSSTIFFFSDADTNTNILDMNTNTNNVEYKYRVNTNRNEYDHEYFLECENPLNCTLEINAP